jgi:pimeloyl-ACP methyl ester carboxylesterase
VIETVAGQELAGRTSKEDNPMMTSTIHLHGSAVAFTDTAAQPTLVLLHAFPFDREMWLPQLKAFAGTARVLAIDLPGFGESAPSQVTFTVESAADTVAKLLDAVTGTGRVVIGGLSMGGYVAMAFARRHPYRVAGLILADTRSEPDDAAARQGREKTIAQVTEVGASGIIDQMLPKLLSDATRANRPDVVSTVRRIASRQTTEAVVAGLLALRDRPDATPGLDMVTVPTLILVGEHDAITPPVLVAGMSTRISGSRVVTIPGAGHLSNLENPDAFNTAVIEFLATVVPAIPSVKT